MAKGALARVWRGEDGRGLTLRWRDFRAEERRHQACDDYHRDRLSCGIQNGAIEKHRPCSVHNAPQERGYSVAKCVVFRLKRRLRGMKRPPCNRLVV